MTYQRIEGINRVMPTPAVTLVGKFTDKAIYDPSAKTALSVRDGVIEYLGSELEMQPPDKLFKVYRSPATIANAAMLMRGLPITDGHVDLDIPAPVGGGSVSEAEMVDAVDRTTDTTIAIRNKLSVSDTLRAMVDAGRRELSLGYRAELVPHTTYDFEQLHLLPHHLATVDSGRCGPMCSFIDIKPTKETNDMPLHSAFTDAEGAMNLQQIVELATALPEAIKSVPVDQLQKLLPALQQIVAASKAAMPEPPGEMQDEGTQELPSGEMQDEGTRELPSGEMQDEGTQKEKEKDAKFADALAQATDKAVKTHGAVIAKAREFLDSGYSFADKSTVQIMRDAIATHNREQFEDSELPLAFKMLRKPDANYKQFGDAQATGLAGLKDKEL